MRLGLLLGAALVGLIITGLGLSFWEAAAVYIASVCILVALRKTE